MSSWFVKLTLAPAGTSIGVGLNWKVWMVTPCSEPAGASSITTTPSTSATLAAPFFHRRLLSIAASSLAHSPLTEIYGAGGQTDSKE
jgi:hypothetical protein